MITQEKILMAEELDAVSGGTWDEACLALKKSVTFPGDSDMTKLSTKQMKAACDDLEARFQKIGITAHLHGVKKGRLWGYNKETAAHATFSYMDGNGNSHPISLENACFLLVAYEMKNTRV